MSNIPSNLDYNDQILTLLELQQQRVQLQPPEQVAQPTVEARVILANSIPPRDPAVVENQEDINNPSSAALDGPERAARTAVAKSATRELSSHSCSVDVGRHGCKWPLPSSGSLFK